MINWTLTDAIAVAIISAIVALVTRLLNGYVAGRKWPTEKRASEADVAVRLTGAAANFIDDLREQLKDQLGRIKELEASDKAKDRTIKEQDTRIEQLITDILHAQQQMRKLEEENRRLRQHDVEQSAQIRRLRLIVRQAGLSEDGLPEDDDGPPS